MDADAKARLASIVARVRANRSATAVGASAVERAKVRIAEKRAEAQRLRVRHLIPLNELTGDAYADEAKLRSLKDDAFNWVTEAVIVVGQHQLCNCCGHRADATAGFYLRQQHVRMPTSKRLKHIQTIPDGFPVEVMSEGVILPRCINCVANETRVDDLLLAGALFDTPICTTNQLRLDL